MKWETPELVSLNGKAQGSSSCTSTGSTPELPPPYCANGNTDLADCAAGESYGQD